jgi:hypothetical protein
MQSGQGQQHSAQQRNAQEQQGQKGASTTNRTVQGRQNQQNESRTTQSRNGQFAAQPNRNERGTRTEQRNAQRNEQLRGLQSSTRAPMQGTNESERGRGAANVSLNDQQRTQIRNTIINSRGAPRVGNVDFGVNVGTVVPRGRIRLVRVPRTLVQIDPAWRGYLYFVYNNEIVIVNPRTMRIVDVLPV